MLDYHGLLGPQHRVHPTVCRLLPASSMRGRKRSRADGDGGHPDRLLTRSAALGAHPFPRVVPLRSPASRPLLELPPPPPAAGSSWDPTADCPKLPSGIFGGVAMSSRWPIDGVSIPSSIAFLPPPPQRLDALEAPWCCESDLAGTSGILGGCNIGRLLCTLQACLPTNIWPFQSATAEVAMRVERFRKTHLMPPRRVPQVANTHDDNGFALCYVVLPCMRSPNISWPQPLLPVDGGIVVATTWDRMRPSGACTYLTHAIRSDPRCEDAASIVLSTGPPPPINATCVESPIAQVTPPDSDECMRFDSSWLNQRLPALTASASRTNEFHDDNSLNGIATGCPQFDPTRCQSPLFMLNSWCFERIAVVSAMPPCTTRALVHDALRGIDARHPSTRRRPSSQFAQADRPPPPNGMPRLYALQRRLNPDDLTVRRGCAAEQCWDRLVSSTSHGEHYGHASAATIVLQTSPLLGGRRSREHTDLSPPPPPAQVPSLNMPQVFELPCCTAGILMHTTGDSIDDGMFSKRDVINASVHLLMEGGGCGCEVEDACSASKDVVVQNQRRGAIRAERIVARTVLGNDSALAEDVAHSTALRLAALDAGTPCEDASLPGRSGHALLFNHRCKQHYRLHSPAQKRARVEEDIGDTDFGDGDVDKGLMLLAQVCCLAVSNNAPTEPKVILVPWVPLLSCHEWVRALLNRLRIAVRTTAALDRCELCICCVSEELPCLQEHVSRAFHDLPSITITFHTANAAPVCEPPALCGGKRRIAIVTPASMHWLGGTEPSTSSRLLDAFVERQLSWSSVVIVIALDIGDGCLANLLTRLSANLHVHCHPYASSLAHTSASITSEASSALASIWLDTLDVHAVHCVHLVLHTFHHNCGTPWAHTDAIHGRLTCSVDMLLRRFWEGDVLPMVQTWLHHVSSYASHISTTAQGNASLHAAVHQLALLAHAQESGCSGVQWLSTTHPDRMRSCQRIAEEALSAVEHALHDARVHRAGDGMGAVPVTSTVLHHLWTMTDRLRVYFVCLHLVEHLYHTLVADGCAYALCAAKRLGTSTDPLLAAALSVPVVSQLALLLRAASTQPGTLSQHDNAVHHAQHASVERSRVHWVQNVVNQLRLDVCVLVFSCNDRATLMAQSMAARSAGLHSPWCEPCDLYATGIQSTAARGANLQVVFPGVGLPPRRRVGLVLCDPAMVLSCSFTKSLVSRVVARCTGASSVVPVAADAQALDVSFIVDAEFATTLATLLPTCDGKAPIHGAVLRALTDWPMGSLVPVYCPSWT